ncbi:chromo domain-containing protein LHP1-like [Rhizophagus irregularis DAOM 181602=DAOM 197198]|nr:chromo domain-containing protein LHP1-like [Rhizophagus irregularis DAOM 181602=DAOM 197198]
MSHLENYYKYYNLSRVPARILKGRSRRDASRPQRIPLFPRSGRSRGRNRIKPPTHRIETDSGSEFTNDQQSYAERSEDFRDVVNKIDEIWQRNPPDIPTGSPKVSKKTELLSEGTWNPNIRVIKKMILSPEQPPTYLLNGPHGRLGVSRCAYTRKELQVVPINEKPPPDSVIRGQPKRFVPEQILRHRIRKGQDQYLVKWERYPDTEATWEPADRLKENVPDLIRKFWE